MRGVVFTGDRQLELMTFPDPTPGPDEVVIEMKASGMCGSDLHQYRRPKAGGETGGLAAPSVPTIALLVSSLGRLMNSRVRPGAIFVKAATDFAAFVLAPMVA